MYIVDDLKSLFIQREKLIAITRSISKISGISISVTDDKGDFLIEPEIFSENCKNLHSTPEGKDNCRQELIKIMSETKQSKAPVVSTCQSGFCKFSTPIIFNNVFYGAILGCQVNFPNRLQALDNVIEPLSEIINRYIKDELELVNLTKEIINNYTEITLLYEMGEIFTKALDEKEAIRIILERILDLTDAQRISLMLLDEETNKLKIVYSKGIPDDIVKNTIVQIGEGISGSVVRDGRPILIENIEDSPELKNLSSSSQAQFKSQSFLSAPVVCSPLKVENRVIGVINISDKKSGQPFTQHDLNLISAISAQIAALIENKRLFYDIKELFLTTIRALTLALDAKDHYTYGHAQQVTKCALAIAEELKLSPELKEDLELASILHDIGKIAVPENILLKPGKLTPEELNEIRKHPVKGAAILQDIKQLGNIIPAILYHHERVDGTGYPMGLKQEQIPLIAKILSVADAYDAMISKRSYRPAMPKDKAVDEIKDNSGTQFDPKVADAFIKAVDKGTI